ncbi:hypothetical protein PR048_009285 [Dryococelus australis]|uniref:Uncharacterized protein n=1 Tax=Dryococelus australis TaxID=614101 RepID=A0ABQ9HZF4_9NEOP|nr:hypothetical protein PR048_009285 [Dryococelus australis]
MSKFKIPLPPPLNPRSAILSGDREVDGQPIGNLSQHAVANHMDRKPVLRVSRSQSEKRYAHVKQGNRNAYVTYSGEVLHRQLLYFNLKHVTSYDRKNFRMQVEIVTCSLERVPCRVPLLSTEVGGFVCWLVKLAILAEIPTSKRRQMGLPSSATAAQQPAAFVLVTAGRHECRLWRCRQDDHARKKLKTVFSSYECISLNKVFGEEIWAALNSEVLRADEGETGDPRENPPTNGIVRYDSHMRKFDDPAEEIKCLNWLICHMLIMKIAMLRYFFPGREGRKMLVYKMARLGPSRGIRLPSARSKIPELKSGGNERIPRNPADQRGIVRHDSHMRKTGSHPAGNGIRKYQLTGPRNPRVEPTKMKQVTVRISIYGAMSSGNFGTCSLAHPDMKLQLCSSVLGQGVWFCAASEIALVHIHFTVCRPQSANFDFHEEYIRDLRACGNRNFAQHHKHPEKADMSHRLTVQDPRRLWAGWRRDSSLQEGGGGRRQIRSILFREQNHPVQIPRRRQAPSRIGQCHIRRKERHEAEQRREKIVQENEPVGLSDFAISGHSARLDEIMQTSNEALGVRVSVARIAPSLLNLECAATYSSLRMKPLVGNSEHESYYSSTVSYKQLYKTQSLIHYALDYMPTNTVQSCSGELHKFWIRAYATVSLRAMSSVVPRSEQKADPSLMSRPHPGVPLTSGGRRPSYEARTALHPFQPAEHQAGHPHSIFLGAESPPTYDFAVPGNNRLRTNLSFSPPIDILFVCAQHTDNCTKDLFEYSCTSGLKTDITYNIAQTSVFLGNSQLTGQCTQHDDNTARQFRALRLAAMGDLLHVAMSPLTILLRLEVTSLSHAQRQNIAPLRSELQCVIPLVAPKRHFFPGAVEENQFTVPDLGLKADVPRISLRVYHRFPAHGGIRHFAPPAVDEFTKHQLHTDRLPPRELHCKQSWEKLPDTCKHSSAAPSPLHFIFTGVPRPRCYTPTKPLKHYLPGHFCLSTALSLKCRPDFVILLRGHRMGLELQPLHQFNNYSTTHGPEAGNTIYTLLALTWKVRRTPSYADRIYGSRALEDSSDKGRNSIQPSVPQKGYQVAMQSSLLHFARSRGAGQGQWRGPATRNNNLHHRIHIVKKTFITRPSNVYFRKTHELLKCLGVGRVDASAWRGLVSVEVADVHAYKHLRRQRMLLNFPPRESDSEHRPEIYRRVRGTAIRGDNNTRAQSLVAHTRKALNRRAVLPSSRFPQQENGNLMTGKIEKGLEKCSLYREQPITQFQSNCRGASRSPLNMLETCVNIYLQNEEHPLRMLYEASSWGAGNHSIRGTLVCAIRGTLVCVVSCGLICSNEQDWRHASHHNIRDSPTPATLLRRRHAFTKLSIQVPYESRREKESSCRMICEEYVSSERRFQLSTGLPLLRWQRDEPGRWLNLLYRTVGDPLTTRGSRRQVTAQGNRHLTWLTMWAPADLAMVGRVRSIVDPPVIKQRSSYVIQSHWHRVKVIEIEYGGWVTSQHGGRPTPIQDPSFVPFKVYYA